MDKLADARALQGGSVAEDVASEIEMRFFKAVKVRGEKLAVRHAVAMIQQTLEGYVSFGKDEGVRVMVESDGGNRWESAPHLIE